MAVRRLTFLATMVVCLALAAPAWAGTYTFSSNFNPTGQGLLSFTPGLNNTLTIGAGNGGNGALITDFMNTLGLCAGDCSITSGFLTLTTGKETSGFSNGAAFAYTFGAGGTIQIFGKVPSLGINVSSLLFSASFLNGGTFAGGGAVGTLAANINLGSINLNPAFGAYHYLIGQTSQLSFNINSPGCENGGACSGPLNQSTNSFTVPEPATLCVVGVGLFAVGTGLRRKMVGRQV